MKYRLLLYFLTTAVAWPRSTTVSIEAAGDTFIRAQEPDRNFAAGDRLEVGNVKERIALFRFDLSSIPANAVVSSVHLNLAFDATATQIEAPVFIACDLSADFQESEASFRHASKQTPWHAAGLKRFVDYGAAYLHYCSPPIAAQNPRQASTDVTSYIQMAVATHRKSAAFAVFSTSANSGNVPLFSHRATDPSLRPRLTLVIDPTAPRAVTNHPFLNTKFEPVIVDGSESSKPDGSKEGLQYLWTVDKPAPNSTNSPGQELGREAKLKFEPDVPGLWTLRLRVTDAATKEFSETSVDVTDIKLAPHPRLGLNQQFIGELKVLQKAKSPEWQTFESWLKNPSDPNYGTRGQGLLLGYALTKNKAYFDAAWGIYAPKIYLDPKRREKGIRNLFGACAVADYCNGQVSGGGAPLTIEIAVLYDWAFDALQPPQRQDILEWLNNAIDFSHLGNPHSHNHFSNDGASIVNALAAAAYATYEENPRRGTLMAWFRQEWAHSLQAMDVIAKGGSFAGGNGYSEVTGGSLIQAANDIYYASGENLFYSHPYFRRHLAFDAFSTYPNRLFEANDPLKHADPPRPIPEGAAFGGDDTRGNSWHTAQLRPNGLALARRFPNTEEADTWNWVFRQKDFEAINEAFSEILFYSPPPVLKKPQRLSFFDPSLGYVYVRSDWDTRDATWIASWGGPHADAHQHLDQGAFALFKRRDLAAKTGNMELNAASAHDTMYYSRTVSSNDLLIADPNEYFSGFPGNRGCDGNREHDLFPSPDGGAKVCIPNDGGQRTMDPYSIGIGNNDIFFLRRDSYDVAKIMSFADNGEAVAWVYDITNAYNNPRYTTPGNKPKVTKVYRKFVYLRQPDIFFVADTVDSTNPEFQKSWLLHGVDHIDIDGAANKLDDGEVIYTGTDQARVVVDDKTPSNAGEVTADLRTGYAALQVKTLYPEKFRYDVIGGRLPNHHIKDFWVKDYSEGIQPDHRSLNWNPMKPQETQDGLEAPTFAGGYGRWRLELQPTVPAKNDYFLNALKPTLETANDMPALTKFETADTFGATFESGGRTYKVTFTKETLDPPVIEGMNLRPPTISNPKPAATLPANTRQTVVSVTTNELSTCRFSYRAGTTYPYMTGAFQSTDGLTHTLVNRELNAGDTYTYFVRCMDKARNENLDDYRLTFSVAH